MTENRTFLAHLIRIGKETVADGVKNDLGLNNDVTRFGRHSGNDHFLDSLDFQCLTSRWHAEVHCVHQEGKTRFILRDNDSVNGTYVNYTKLKSNHVLENGDIVMFGHPNGRKIKPGEKAETFDAELIYKFESTVKEEPKDPVPQPAADSPVIPQTAPPVVRTERRETPEREASVRRNILGSGRGTLVLKDISNKRPESPGLVHLDELFNTHGMLKESPIKRPSSQSTIGSSSQINDDVITQAVKAAENFGNMSDSEQDISIDDLGVQPLGKVRVNKPGTSYPSLNEVFDKGHQLTTASATVVPYKPPHEEQVCVSLSEVNPALVAPPRISSPSSSAFRSPFSSPSLGNHENDYSPPVAKRRKRNNTTSSTDSLQGKKRRRSKKWTQVKKRTQNKLSLPSDGAHNETAEYHTEEDPCDAFDCIRPAGDKVSWVQCDDCDKWYHTECAGCSYKSVKSSNASFSCGCL